MRVGPPREHGLTSVWLAALIYGLAQVRELSVLLPVALAASVATLLLADGFLDCFATRRLAGCSSGFAAIFVPYTVIMILRPSPIHIAVVGLTAVLAVVLHASTRTAKVTHYSTIAGGTMISLHAYFIMAAGGADLVNALFLPVYTAMSVAQAAIRVIGQRRDVAAFFYVSMIGMLAYAATRFPPAGLLVAAGDAASRVFQEVSGLSERMSIKRYGLTELARGLVVLGTLGVLLR